jgi:hypothetical protein
MKVLHLHSCVVMFIKWVIIPARADRDMCSQRALEGGSQMLENVIS